MVGSKRGRNSRGKGDILVEHQRKNQEKVEEKPDEGEMLILRRALSHHKGVKED